MTFTDIRNACIALGTCLALSANCLAAGDSSDETTPSLSTNLTGFEIPFSIDDSDGRYIEVQLYISRNQGKDWQFYQSKPVSSNHFKFKSSGDGEYWFAMKTLDRDRKLIPGGRVVVPEMKITVDTVKPKVDFKIAPDPSGRVIAEWRAQDANLDTSTLRISYRNSGNRDAPWLPVEFKANRSPISGSYVDQIGWWPENATDNIDVRFEIADAAGNSVTATRATPLMQSTIPRTNFSSTFWRKRQPTESERCPGGVCQVPPAQSNSQTASTNSLKSKADGWFKGVFKKSGTQANKQPPTQPRSDLARKSLTDTTSKSTTKPDAIPWKSKTSKWVQREQSDNGTTIEKNQFPAKAQEQFALQRRFDDVPIVDRKQLPKVENELARQQGQGTGNDMFVTESTTMKVGKQEVPVTLKHAQESQLGNDRQWGRADSGLERGSSHHQKPEYVDPPKPDQTSQFVPANPVSSAAPPRPARLGKIDRGNIPTLKANSARFKLNYNVRSIDPSGVGKVILWSTVDGGRTWNSISVDQDNKSPMPVQVPSEGTYGFKVVINSRDGLTGKPPMSGDMPDVWVDVDWTRPQVQINSVPYGSGKDVGKLIIQFSASDENLAIRPIRLFYSPNLDGPWTTIEDGLRNTGSYAWKVPSQVPENVYLRIEARDTANNLAAYQLTSPIDLSGLVPRGRIYGVEPISQ